MDDLSVVENAGHENSVEPQAAISRDAAPISVIGRPFPKGQTGNPNGRPKGVKSLVRDLRRAMTPERRAEIMERLVDVACDPTHREWMNAVKLIWDRRDGPIVRELAVSGNVPQVLFNVHLPAPGERTLPELPSAHTSKPEGERVIDVPASDVTPTTPAS